ncbi:MAG TPA: hypothetical protein VMK66_10790 [Myxococcales bacterium]|nr:hypothetical protein [Myxococcales bacterium]
MGKTPAQRPRSLLDAARAHEETLQAHGLAATALERYENALRGLRLSAGESTPQAQVLVRDVQREVEEFQAAIRKEFPGDEALHLAFRARERMPRGAREVLALGRLVAREAAACAPRLIKYGLNAATVKHLDALCEQLEGELGGADPVSDARAVEQEIVSAARRAFLGKPELAAFEGK